MTRKELEQYIIDWNIKFPVDRWWREKHKVPFLSERHKQISFVAQLMEYVEDKMYYEQANKKTSEYTPNIGDFIKTENSDIPMSNKELMEDVRRELAEYNKMNEDGR